MKKVVSILLCMILVFMSVSTLASETTDSDAEKVLLKLLDRITIPAEYDTYEYITYSSNDGIEYNFWWEKTGGYQYDSIDVTCDSEGRILSYSSCNESDCRWYNVDKQDVIDYAEKAAKKMFPEAFANENDRLVYDESSYFVSPYDCFDYYLRFDRIRNSVPVENNDLSMSISFCDGQLVVENAYMWYDYDIDFDETEVEIENIKDAYFKEIPLELVYVMKYNQEKKDFVPSIAYFLSGDSSRYLDLSTGNAIDWEYEIFNPYLDSDYRYDEMYEYPQYLELDSTVEGLLSTDDIINSLKKIPEIQFISDAEFGEPDLYKEWDGTYYYSFYFYDEENEIDCNIIANAVTGKLVGVNNYSYNEENRNVMVSVNNVEKAGKNIDKFLNSVCKDEYSQAVQTGSYVDGCILSKHYTRVVNGLEFISDYISIEYNIVTNSVEAFSLNYTNIELPVFEASITADEAEQLIVDNVEFEKLYTSKDDKCVKALIPEGLNHVDALTGDVITYSNYLPEKIHYSDISGHWVEEIALKLAEANIGIRGGRMEPDKDITVGEYLELMFINSKIFPSDVYLEYYELEPMLEYFVNCGFLPEGATKDSTMTREDAFKSLVSYMGYGDVAKLDIYKVDYADSHLLSDGKVGYAAILSGMGVISGDGSYLYPDKNLTRAETLAMVYKFLKRN